MLHLTARDWFDIRLAAILLVVCTIFDGLLLLYLRRKKPALPFQAGLFNPSATLFWVFLVAMAPILGRRGLPAWVATAVLVLLFVLSLLRVSRRARRELAANAGRREVAGLNNDAGQEPLVSREEKRLAAIWQLALLGLIVTSALALGLVLFLVPPTRDHAGKPVELFKIALVFGAAACVFAGIYHLLFQRWPGTVRRVASIDISASRDSVWDALVLRNDYPGWRKTYTGIERLDELGEVYRLHHATDRICPRCGLSQDPDRSTWSSTVAVLEARRPAVYRVRTVLSGLIDNRDARSTLDWEGSSYRLQALPDGSTRVSYCGLAARPKVWLALLILLGGPGREHLRSLKAHLEGTDDDSLSGVSARRMEVARRSAQMCQCPAQA